MNSRICLIFNCLIVSFFLVSTAQAQTYLESGGVVTFEAESSPANGQWQRASSIGGAKGGAYLIWNGPNLFGGNVAGRDPLTYTFRVQTPGNYELRWRSRIGHGTNRTEANDSWVRFPTGRNVPGQHALNGWTKAFQNQINQWSWSARTTDNVGNPIRQFFSAGDHTVQISGRSTGHAIDRIVLFRYSDVSFSASRFDSFNVSSTVGGSQPPNQSQNDEAEAAAAARAAEQAAAAAAARAAEEAAEAAAAARAEEQAQAAAERAAEEARAQAAAERAEEEARAQLAAENAAEQARAQAAAQAAAQAEEQAAAARAEAPQLSADGLTLRWNAVSANSINVHNGRGEWLLTLSGSATSWTAPNNGSFFVVATNDQDWRSWGRSNTVEVNTASSGSSASSSSSGATGSITSLTGTVYSRSALEIFWSTSGNVGAGQFEVYRNNDRVFSGSASSYFDDQLSSGSYTYRLVQLDSGQAIGERSITLQTGGDGGSDTVANSSASSLNLSGSVYSRTALELTWDRSSGADAAGQLSTVYQDGVIVASSDAVSYFVDGLRSGQTYQFMVAVQDSNGNEVGRESIALTTFSGDDATVLVSQSNSVDIQIQQSSGFIANATNVFEDVSSIGQSVVSGGSMQVFRSADGNSIFLSAATKSAAGSQPVSGVSTVEIDQLTGFRLGTSFVASAKQQ